MKDVPTLSLLWPYLVRLREVELLGLMKGADEGFSACLDKTISLGRTNEKPETAIRVYLIAQLCAQGCN